MRENEFEKKMQERMDDLELRPSASVWPKVERQLVQKKRRRFAYFFVLLAGLAFVGYMGYTFLQSEESPVTKQESTGTNNNNSTTNSSASDKNNTSAITGNKENTVDNKNENNPAVAPATKTPGNGGITVTNTTSLTHPAPDEKGTAVSKGSAGNTKKKQTIQSPASHRAPNGDQVQTGRQDLKESREAQVEFSTTSAGVAKKENQDNVLTNPDPATNNAVADGKQITDVKKDPEEKPMSTVADSTQSTKEIIAAISDSAATDPAKPMLAKSKKTRTPIKWGFDLSAGKNFSLGKVFSVFEASNNYSQDALTSGLYASPGGAGNVSQPLPPSDIKAKAGFKVGIAAEKKIGKKSSVSAGLRYAYLTEEIKTGRFENRAVISNSYQFNAIQNGVYRSTQQESHTNSYHFVEIPLLYQAQLNKSAKTALIWNAGISLNYLLATNALLYDTAAGGVYYKKNSEFNKFNLSFRTGLSVRFGKENKFQWSVGPELSMSATPLLKRDAVEKKRYLMYGGLTARFILPQRKK